MCNFMDGISQLDTMEDNAAVTPIKSGEGSIEADPPSMDTFADGQQSTIREGTIETAS
jgi:hypothetical protein